MRNLEGWGPTNELLIFSDKAIKKDGKRCLDIGRLGRTKSWKESKEGEPRKAWTALLNAPESVCGFSTRAN